MTERHIAWALLVSFILHALLLWPAAPSRQSSQTSAQGSVLLAATLHPNAVEVGEGLRPESWTADSDPPLREQTARPPDRRLLHKLPADPPAENAAPLAGAATADPRGLDAAAAPVNAVDSPATITRMPSQNEGIDADGLRKFRLDLAAQARRSKHYPVQALAAGWHGTVEVRLTIEGGGTLRQPELLQSSGFALLDDAALAMLALAAPQTAIPESLSGRTFPVVLPVVFDAKSE